MKKKILHIIPRYYPGGAERLVLQYADLLDSSQYDVHVASCVDDGALRAEFEAIGASIWIGTGTRHAIFRKLKAYVRVLQPDIIHTHLLSSDVTGALLKRSFPEVTWISTLHNTEDDRPWLYRRIWRWALGRADYVIAVSPAVKKYAQDVFHVPEEKTTMIPNGIALEKWIHIATNTLFATRPYQIATIGRLEKQKGHQYLLEALGTLKKYDWQYHLYGDGSLHDSLASQAKHLGISSRVIFHGNVPDVPFALANIDLVVQPSLWEGMSLTVMEAMAAGRPLIASNAAGDGLIIDKKTGYVVADMDSKSIRSQIAYLLSHIDEARRIGHAARKKAQSDFSIHQHIDRVEAVYEVVSSK